LPFKYSASEQPKIIFDVFSTIDRYLNLREELKKRSFNEADQILKDMKARYG